MRKQIHKAVHILNKVQINVEDHLMALAKETIMIDNRDFIIEYLTKISKEFDTSKQETWLNFYKHWTLLKYLEKSFETDGTFKQNKVFGSGKDRVVVNESEIKLLTIDKIEVYPDEWKNKVATSLFFDCFGKFFVALYNISFTLFNAILTSKKHLCT